MCLAISKPKGVHIKRKYLLRAFVNNPHGAGFAVAKDNQIEVHKGFFDFAEFWTKFQEFQSYAAIVHFRWSTHGLIDDNNCHPFTICSGGMAMIHNGILSAVDRKEDMTKSDTFHFAHSVMSPILEQVPLDSPALQFLVEECIGGSNKLVVLRWDGFAKIFNEGKGHWKNGAWYSNYSYSTVSTRTRNSSFQSYSSPRRYTQGEIITPPYHGSAGNFYPTDEEIAASYMESEDAEFEETEEEVSFLPGDADKSEVPPEFAKAWKEYLSLNDSLRTQEDETPFCGG